MRRARPDASTVVPIHDETFSKGTDATEGRGSLLERDVDRHRDKRPRELSRIDPHQKPAAPAVDVDLLERQDRLLDVHRHRLLGPEGARAADLVARVPPGHLGRARLDLLLSDLPREVLRRDLAVAVREDDERLLLLVLHHERLHDLVLGHAELLRRHARAASLLVLVRMLGERDGVLL
jgi:hypothetical protein